MSCEIIDIKANWPDSNPLYSVKEIPERGTACLEKLGTLTNMPGPKSKTFYELLGH